MAEILHLTNHWAPFCFGPSQLSCPCRQLMSGLVAGTSFKDPDVHAMLRQSNRTQTTPVAQSVWDKYVKAHFQPREAAQLVRGGVALSVREMAVPLGSHFGAS
eukprot:1153493-Pelagomonas_calceolata.AAC.3